MLPSACHAIVLENTRIYAHVSEGYAMQRTTVSSSNLASVGYDATTETLEIEFQNGAVYQYFSVPVQVYHGLMQAESHGSYFNEHIKNGGFRYRKV